MTVVISTIFHSWHGQADACKEEHESWSGQALAMATLIDAARSPIGPNCDAPVTTLVLSSKKKNKCAKTVCRPLLLLRTERGRNLDAYIVTTLEGNTRN